MGLCCLLSKYAELSGGCMLEAGAMEDATGEEGANDGDGGELNVLS